LRWFYDLLGSWCRRCYCRYLASVYKSLTLGGRHCFVWSDDDYLSCSLGALRLMGLGEIVHEIYLRANYYLKANYSLNDILFRTMIHAA
jgi:hypothetical protein